MHSATANALRMRKACLDATMTAALTNALSSSSAHGISRAVGNRPTPLKVMWIVLFAVFLAIFLKSGISLMIKLRDNRLSSIYRMDQVPFVVPDLYFCPNNPYSGSYPFQLSKEEAEEINSAMIRIERRYENLTQPGRRNVFTRALHIQTALPFHLSVKYLTLRREQSVLKSTLISNFISNQVEMEPFYTMENIVCFKALLTEDLKQKMTNPSSAFEVWLSTDPYFSDLNFTGYSIRNIVDRDNESVPFLAWHPQHIVEELKVHGYTMLLVPPGTYPSLRFENCFHMAPGNAYAVKLLMEENKCSEELQTTYCSHDHPPVGFISPLTGQTSLFGYSSSACYYLSKNAWLTKTFGCKLSLNPSPSEYSEWPMCLNVSEITQEIAAKLEEVDAQTLAEAEMNIANYCQRRVPCHFPRYKAEYSFGKWPGIGSTTDHYFAKYFQPNETRIPALTKLVNIARQMQSGNHSAHLEGIFRSYVSESLIRARISMASVMASQVVLTWSYTFAELLADTGGLLGLYIGCSLLTLCEMLELAYVLIEGTFKRSHRSSTEAQDQDNASQTVSADKDCTSV